MAKKWNDYTRREKMIGGIAAVFGVFIIGGIANGMSNPAPVTPAVESTQQVKAQSVTTTKEITETEVVAFEKKSVDSGSYDKGTTQVTTTGVNGEKTLTYTVTLVDGVETQRVLLTEEVSTAPVTEVTSVGTYVAPAKPAPSASCDPNYSGACVPIASDVDCGGGSGNGPAYLYGTARVVGTDIYGLDRDGDGLACE